MAAGKLFRTMMDNWLALPSSESNRPSIFSKCSNVNENILIMSIAGPAAPAIATALK